VAFDLSTLPRTPEQAGGLPARSRHGRRADPSRV